MRLLILFLISITASASYLPKSKIGQVTDGIIVHSLRSACESAYSEPCISVHGIENMEYSVVVPLEYDEVSIESCSGMLDCDTKLQSLTCTEGYLATKEESRVLCLKNIPEYIGIDSTKKAAYDSDQTFKAIEAIAAIKIACAVKVKAHVGALNLFNGKTSTEIQAIMTTYVDVIKLLDAGALDTALALITSLPTTVEIDQAYKDSVIAKINSCNVSI